jgi:hypothetical protein
MKNIQDIDNFTNESIRGFFSSDAQYVPSNPKHKQLYNSFINWFKEMREKYNEDLIINMISSAEEDIEYGEI